MHKPDQNIAFGNWLLDQFEVERQRMSWGGRVAAYAVGAGAFALLAWGVRELFERDAELLH